MVSLTTPVGNVDQFILKPWSLWSDGSDTLGEGHIMRPIDILFNQNPFMDSGDIDCACQLSLCMHAQANAF